MLFQGVEEYPIEKFKSLIPQELSTSAEDTEFLTIHDSDETFCYGISKNDYEKILQNSQDRISELENKYQQRDSEIAAEFEKVNQKKVVEDVKKFLRGDFYEIGKIFKTNAGKFKAELDNRI